MPVYSYNGSGDCDRRDPRQSFLLTDPERIDPERLAALLDGRLGDAEAEAVRRELARSDEDTLAAFADAAAVAAELEQDAAADAPAQLNGAIDGTRTNPVTPLEAARSRRPRRRWMVPAAAAAAAAAIVSIIVWRPTRDSYLPRTLARSLPPAASTAEGPVWGANRGVGGELPPRIRAARIGATLVDLEVDARAGRSTRDNALALANLLDGALGGSPAAGSIRALPAGSIAKLSSDQLTTLGSESLDLVDREFAQAAAYLEAARLASTAGDTAFFVSTSAAPAARLSSVSPPIDAPTREALAALTDRLNERPRNVPGIRVAAGQLLRAITQ